MKTIAQHHLPMFPVLRSMDSADRGDPTFLPRRAAVVCSRARVVSPTPRSLDMSPAPRSPSIPISSDMSSASLDDDMRYDEAMADQLDYLMFTRIMSHLARQNQEKCRYMISPTESLIMKNIIRTRKGCGDRALSPDRCNSVEFFPECTMDSDDETLVEAHSYRSVHPVHAWITSVCMHASVPIERGSVAEFQSRKAASVESRFQTENRGFFQTMVERTNGSFSLTIFRFRVVHTT
jgi:hypothetical protein